MAEQITFDRGCFACVLGGVDRRTLFVLAAEWDDPTNIEQNMARRTGRIYAIEVDVPGAGRP